MSIIHNNSIVGASGNQNQTYNIQRSLRFRKDAVAYLTRTPASAGNRKTFTYSAWVKRGSLGSLHALLGGSSATANTYNTLRFNADVLQVLQLNGSGTYDYEIYATNVFRDPAAWYHFVFAFDSTQATASNRVKLYVNNAQITSFSAANYPALNTDNFINNNTQLNIGRATYNGSTDQPFDGYMTDINFVDGQALTPASFGESDAITGVWKPKRYAGSYGTNGFKLDFSDNSAATAAAIGKDSSGNGNNWTPNNISVTAGATYDSMTDVPTLTSATAANYAVLNPLASNIAPTNGNLVLPDGGVGVETRCAGTIAMSSGKFYFEDLVGGTYCNCQIGIYPADKAVANATLRYVLGKGDKYDGTTSTPYGSPYASGDVIGVAVDLDNGKIWFSINGTFQASGNPVSGTNAAFTGLSGTYLPFFTGYSNGGSNTSTNTVNFGQRPFTYTPPSGFKALNTFNLPDSAIPAGNKVMDATTYTGNATARSITNAGGFQPDLVWVKSRSNSYNHYLVDSVRGTSKFIVSNNTDAEGTYTQGLTSFNSNGFSLGTDNGSVNGSGSTFVGWQWQAGQGTTATNTSGSITSTVSVNPSAGFSVLTYNGGSSPGTVGHGLGVAPAFMIVRIRGATSSTPVYHQALGNTKTLYINSTDASYTNTAWNNTTPTSTVFSVGGPYVGTNDPGYNFVAYCWSEVAGFSKFGSYTGNGSADGPFVYLGFKPKYVLIKNTTTTGNTWAVYDSARDVYNVSRNLLTPQGSAAEADYLSIGIALDFTSNGFKIRGSQDTINKSGDNFIYACFAENPFKNSLAR